MNTLDLIVISVVVLSGLFAFVRGFVREGLSIAAWIGAGLVAYYGYERFAPTVARLVPNPLAAQLTTAGVLFVVSLLVFSVLVGIVSDRVRMSRLGSVDRSLGLLFGLARGLLVVCLGYVVATHAIEPGVWPPKADRLPVWMAEARSRPYLEEASTPLVQMVPERLLDRSAAAATQAVDTVDSAAKARQLQNMVDPPPVPATPDKQQSQPAPAYDNGQRQDLNRAIEQSTGQQD
jgi:membrane protein required for colicin V production